MLMLLLLLFIPLGLDFRQKNVRSFRILPTVLPNRNSRRHQYTFLFCVPRGAGDVVFPMGVSILSCWLMSVFFSYLLGVKMGFGLFGCWIAFGMDEAFRGVNYLIRWRSRKWMKKTVVISEENKI